MTRSSLKRFLALAGTVLASTLALAQPARALPIMIGNVTVNEFDTGFGDTTDTVAIVPGPEFSCCAGNNINALLLTGEAIDIGPSSILFTIHGGGDAAGHSSGYLDTGYIDADYTFSGIGFDTPGHISNVSFSLTNAADFTGGPAVLNWTDTSIFVHLAGIGILSSPLNLGQLRLNVTTVADAGPDPDPIPVPDPTAVPEPTSMLLVGSGLAALFLHRRKNALR
jgi:hypothetical protein